jgi:hypothetical protein
VERTGPGLERVAGKTDIVRRTGPGLEGVAGKTVTVERTGPGLERQGENVCDYLYLDRMSKYLYTINVTL